MQGWSCCCVWDRIWVVYLCNPLFVESKAKVFLKPFKFKVFFKLSENQPVILSKQPIVLVLGVFEKVENYFGWLTCCQTKTIYCFVISIDCFFENPNRILFC